MKTGIIVYVTGETSLREEPRLERLEPSPRLWADRVALASDMEELVDHWFSLTVRGAQQITCLMAEAGEQNRLWLTGRELRLCG